MILRLLISSVLVIALAACDGCSDPVAVLRDAEGTVDGELGGADWAAVAVRQEFRVEDAVRTGGTSSARIHLVGGGDLRLGEHTMLVFHPGRAEAFSTLLEIETGEVLLESGESPIQLLTEIGELVLERSSEARVRTEGGETRVQIAIGRATIERIGDGALDLGELDTLVVGLSGEARVESAPSEEPPPTAPDAEPIEPEPEAVPETASVELSVSGGGVRVRREPGGTRESLESGETSVPRGASLSIPRRSRVTVSAGNARVSARGRAAATIPATGLLSVEIGAAEMITEGDPISMEVPGAVVRSSGGGRAAATVAVSRRGAEIAVSSGRFTVETAGGEEELRAGDSIRVAPSGLITVEEEAPTRADVAIVAGESATIHDGRPPTTVRITVAGCAGTVVATANGRRFEGEGGAIIPVRGNTRYEARCGEGENVRGTLRARRDSGRAPLLRSAPTTRVDADGRTYRVHYQNLLPEVEVRWREAPEGSDYRLELTSGGGPRTLTLSAPRHVFSSGQLREGSHRFRFVGPGGASSPWGSIVIAFDNAAPTAFVREPADGSLAPGAQATISGQLLEGFRASVDGRELSLDGQRRFSAEATVPSDGRALAIRAAHPSHGVHYYLRHAAGGSE